MTYGSIYLDTNNKLVFNDGYLPLLSDGGLAPTPSATPIPSSTPIPSPSPTPTPIPGSQGFDILLVSGGASAGNGEEILGGSFAGGGGGGGGYIFVTGVTLVETSYDIVIGGGDEASLFGEIYLINPGGTGGNSQSNGANAPNDDMPYPGEIAGCGGGAGDGVNDPMTGGSGDTGYDGGNSLSIGEGNGAGGGGGLGGNGETPAAGGAGDGGPGKQFPIFGNEYYGGGGGAGAHGSGSPGIGSAGGGNGGYSIGLTNYEPTNAEPNTGSGGGGGTKFYNGYGGGSGICKIRHLTSEFPDATGGDITTEGSYTFHTFLTSDTFLPLG